jgi:hypothetical protein
MDFNPADNQTRKVARDSIHLSALLFLESISVLIKTSEWLCRWTKEWRRWSVWSSN